jgi:acyl-CoA thioesterase FadM
MKHIEKYRVYYYDTDRNFNIKLFNLARYLQETALIAFEKHEEANKEMRDKKLAFFLTKISLKFESEIKKFDNINIETWALPPTSASFTRNYRVFSEMQGKYAVSVVSSWVLVNIESKAIVRSRDLSEHFIAISTDNEELGFAPIRRIKIPEEKAKTLLLEKEVCYSDIDENLHMNNAVYFNVIQDALFKASKELNVNNPKLSSLDISFEKAALEGEQISVYGITAESESEIYLQGTVGNHSCFTAKANLSKNS